MKKVVFFLFSVLLLTSCSSGDDSVSTSFESTIFIDNVAFVPTRVTVSESEGNFPNESGLVFAFQKGSQPTSVDESIVVRISYPTVSSNAPNGVYDFGAGVIGEVMFAQGSYMNGAEFYSLAGYTVQVTKLGNKSYRIDFQNIQAVKPFSDEIIIISGYFEGAMQ